MEETSAQGRSLYAACARPFTTVCIFGDEEAKFAVKLNLLQKTSVCMRVSSPFFKKEIDLAQGTNGTFFKHMLVSAI